MGKFSIFHGGFGSLIKTFLLIASLPPLLCGCKHHIDYSLKESDHWNGPAITGVVFVQPITDQVNLGITNCFVQIGKKTWATNYRKGYENTNFSAAVTAVMVKHLAYSGLFTKVMSGTNANADYYLSGTLTDYEARGLPNDTARGIVFTSALLGSLAGATVGLAVTAGMKSDYESTVKLTDLNLTDKSGRSVWHDSICISTNYSGYFAVADPDNLCSIPDDFLKNTISQMIFRLGNSSLTNHTNAVTH